MGKTISNLDKALKQNITPADIGAAASSHGTHVTYSTTAPKVAGTAAVGSANNVARGDHVHPVQTSVSGNAGTATKLATARTLTVGNTGKIFDGSANVSWSLSEIGAAASSHTHTTINGVYTSNGGAQPPSYVGGGTVRFNMMNKFKGLSGLPTYADCILMDTYTGSDVPYVTGLGILKQSGNPRAFIAVGAKGNTTTWAKETELLTVANYKTHITPSNIGAAASSHGTHLTLGTTSSTAYRGDYGNTAYNHSQAAHAPSNAQKNSDITKAEIEAKLTGNITSHSHSSYATTTTTGSLSSLQTSAKGSLVAAINELFQNANNGKQLIANAIGNPSITVNSTFSAMSGAIEELSDKADNLDAARDTLAELMKEGGYDITGDEDINSLLDLLVLSGITVNEIKQIASRVNFAFILKYDGSLWATGRNTAGQLGLGDTTDRTTFTQVTININNDVEQVACGSNFTYILKKDGSLWSCGYALLGLGSNTTYKYVFTQVTTNINNDVKQVACGYNFTYILKKDGSVWSTGKNGNGQLGLGDTSDRTTFTQVTTNINNDVKQIACGNNHIFILKNDGSLWSCGDNDYGQLGLGTSGSSGSSADKKTFTKVTTNINNDVKYLTCGYYHTFIIKNNGSVWCCGYNGNGGLGLNSTTAQNIFTQVTTNISNDVKQIACGHYHTVIIKNNGSVWSCGDNDHGQLGLGNTTAQRVFTQVTTNINNDAKQVVCGHYHTYIIKKDGVWVCGYNSDGQLGLGSNTVETDKRAFTMIPKGIY